MFWLRATRVLGKFVLYLGLFVCLECGVAGAMAVCNAAGDRAVV